MVSKVDSLKKFKIGILAGGSSSEREISLQSGRAVFGVLKSAGLNVTFIDVEEDKFISFIGQTDIDAAFIALHGKFGEDGTIQKILDRRKILYTGSGPESSRLAIDKVLSKKIFQEVGLDVPEYVSIQKGKDITALDIQFPCVVKPRYEGSSYGLSVVLSNSAMQNAVKNAFDFDNEIIIENFITGREITVGVLGSSSLPVVEIVTPSGIYDFSAKYHADDTKYIVPAELERQEYQFVQEVGLKAHNALGCKGFSRVDLKLSDEGKAFVLEVNTIPGLTERSLLPMAAKEAGLDFLQLCVTMLCEVL